MHIRFRPLVPFSLLLLGLMVSGCAAKTIQQDKEYLAKAKALTEAAKAQISKCADDHPDLKACKVPEFWLNPVASVRSALFTSKVTTNQLRGYQEELISGLLRNGFLKLSPDSEYEIPPGAIIIYFGEDVYSEIKGNDGFYYSNRARKGSAFDGKIELFTSATLVDKTKVNTTKSIKRFDSFYAFAKPAK